MIGGGHQHDGVRVSGQHCNGGQPDTRRGVPSAGFDQNLVCGDMGQLSGRFNSMSCPGHDPGLLRGNRRLAPTGRLLNQGLVTRHSQKLFGQLTSTLGPETRAGTASHDHCL